MSAHLRRLLVCTTEALDRRGPDTLAALLGGPPITIRRRNERRSRPTADLYERFRRRFRPGDDYLDEMYGNRVARHFYDGAALEGFRRSWSGPPDPA